MANPFDDALKSLQAPQEAPMPGTDIAARNAAIINQFNHSNAHDRARKNAQKVTPPNYDALMQKLATIDALQMRGLPVDSGRFSPEALKMANTAYAINKPDLAGNILAEEERKIRARDAIGGAPLSTMAWEKLRDHAGQQAVHRHGSEEKSDPMSSIMQQPSASSDLYRIGVDSFDRTFGKHKRYLVEDNLTPNFGMAPPVNQPSPQKITQAAPAVESAPMPQNAPPMTFSGQPDPGLSAGVPRMPLPMPQGVRLVGDQS